MKHAAAHRPHGKSYKFEGAEKLEKQLRKVREPWEYEVVVNQIFTLPFRP